MCVGQFLRGSKLVKHLSAETSAEALEGPELRRSIFPPTDARTTIHDIS